jgi:hypothetical protein
MKVSGKWSTVFLIIIMEKVIESSLATDIIIF